ncbi:SufE family protein [Pseudidiomarina insulisalsae]|uniref:SufE family protein n=1 Tax=Pseudidiomarina insulisalsae TaxID=575789 RepID=UPI00130065CC|nr:SufE family protein [Pseudidiomarina insulisalsae]
MYGKLTQSDLSQLQSEARQQPQRLKFLIQLASRLPPMATELKQPENEVQGCEAQVWLTKSWQNDQLQLQLDSSSRVVKGLLALVFLALHGANKQQVASFDLDALLALLGLQSFVSSSRRNGLRAVVQAMTS